MFVRKLLKTVKINYSKQSVHIISNKTYIACKLCRVTPFTSNIRYQSSVQKSKMSDLSRAHKVAVCQMTSVGDKDTNFNTCRSLIESAAIEGAKIAFLPEACDYVAESKNESIALAESLDGELVTKYKELARKYKIWISLGGIHEKVDDTKVQNAHVMINDKGEMVSVYRKLHLFDVEIPEKGIRLKESDYVKQGTEIVKPVQSPVGEVGLAICYDMRFPEMSQVLRNMGANILTFPSAFTFATGAMHWEVLLRSRAIETQCYVVAAAQVGAHNKKRTSWGHAMIIDPLGNIIGQCSEGTGIAVANIDQTSIENVRKSMPILQHKRTDMYPEMVPNNSFINSKDEPKYKLSDYQFGQVLIPERNVFYRTNMTMAFVNKRCVVPGHVLVAPLRPALRLSNLTTDEVADLFITVQKVQNVMEAVHNAKSTTIAVQDGPEAGRTITHLHVHILPRKEGDFLQNDQVYYELQQHDKMEDKPWRSQDEMNEEAAMLTKYFSSNDLSNTL